MPNKVRLKKGQLDLFRRRALASPLEIQAYLLGYIVSPTLTVVKRLVYPKSYRIQTKKNVQWTGEEYEEVRRLAERLGCRIVGDIHSHPEWDSVMSQEDYIGSIEGGHRVCGIVSTHKGKSHVRFWVMDNPVACEIVYEKKKGTPAELQENPE